MIFKNYIRRLSMTELIRMDTEEVYSFTGNITSYVHEEDNENEHLSLEEQCSEEKFYPQIGKFGYSDIDMLSWRDFL
jgi:hypothetical protein